MESGAKRTNGCSEDEFSIARIRRGDCVAFQALVERHSPDIYRLAFRMTGNPIDAEDIVQETFLRAWKQISRFDGRASFGTWVHRICANCALDHIRARKRRRDTAGGDPLETAVHHDPSPERLARSSEIASLLLPALDQLTDVERAAFVMRHYEGLGIDDISQALGVGASATKHSVFRAVRKLRRALKPVMSGQL